MTNSFPVFYPNSYAYVFLWVSNPLVLHLHFYGKSYVFSIHTFECLIHVLQRGWG